MTHRAPTLLGRIALHLYHNPIDRLMDLVRDGGPWTRRRTEQGRTAMKHAAGHLPALAAPSGAPLELHLLTGERFWYQTAFCLWSFAHQAGRPLAPVIYDDGTLRPEFREPLQTLFPLTRFVSQAETIAQLDQHLPTAKFPALRERWINYPNIRKLTDVHVGRAGWKLVLDSDLLFFNSPHVLVDWLARPTQPLHAIDCETSYGYSRPLMNELAGASVAELVNVGLTGLNGAEIDWARLEYWCHTLIERERPSYYLEQALIAMLVAGRRCTITPRADYITLPVLPEARDCRAVMHHYVAGSKRWYFQHCWQEALKR